MIPAIIVHGGAWRVPLTEYQDRLDGVRKAVDLGYGLLANGRSSLDAVEEAVKLLEDDPAFNAGKGSHPNERGEVEMDAMIMDGRRLRFGSVAAVHNVRHPIALARMVMEDGRHCMMVGEGAVEFARRSDMEMVTTRSLLGEGEPGGMGSILKGQDPREGERPEDHMGTVGAVAIDEEGRISAATSTGGTPQKRWGRVGDTPIIGCGTYADNSVGVSATGHGESIMRTTLAIRAVGHLEKTKNPMRAASEAIREMERLVDGQGGLIMIDSRGETGYAHNTTGMAFALRRDKEQRAGVKVEHYRV